MSDKDRASDIAMAIILFRQVRTTILPSELFSEPAWDALLLLFIADSKGRSVTGREIARKMDIVETVMSRWLKHLTAIGFIIGDGKGDLDDQLTLSGTAFENMERVINEAKILQEAISA